MPKVRPGLPVLLLLCGTIAVVCILYARNWLPHGREIVTPETVVIRQEVFLCGDCRTVYYGPAPSALLGLGTAALAQKYPASQGWVVVSGLPGELRIIRHVQDLCPRHRAVRHLGLCRDHLAVYAGPLGVSGKLLRVEKIHISALSPAQQEKLRLAAEFDKQPPEIRAMLRRDLEFPDEATMLAVLENLDELQD